MVAADIYNTYLSLAEESDYIINIIAKSGKTQNQIAQLDCHFIHRNIKFVFKKLISLLSNKTVWEKYLQPCQKYGYNATSPKSVSLNAELEFLLENREEIIRQLQCMFNTTAFETDLKFLEMCVTKLRGAYYKLKSKNNRPEGYPLQYSIAS